MNSPTTARSVLTLACGILLACTLPGQVITVGSSSQYYDLNTTVTNAPEGAVILLPIGKAYNNVTINNKALTIIGASSQPVLLRNNSVINLVNLAAGKEVRIVNIAFAGDDDKPMLIGNCAGSVVFDRVIGHPGIMVYNCSDVYLCDCECDSRYEDAKKQPRLQVYNSTARVERCRFTGADLTCYMDLMSMSYIVTYGSDGVLIDNSTVMFHRTQVKGGDGTLVERGYGSQECFNSTGYTGMVVRNGSDVTFLGGSITGGAGGDGTGIFTYPPWSYQRQAMPGGTGVLIQGSTMEACGAGVAGGLGGFEPTTNSRVGSGLPVTQTASTYISHPSYVPPAASLQGTMVLNGTIRFQLQANPSSMAVLVLGTERMRYPLAPYGYGWVHPAPMLICGPYLVPPGGTLTLPDPSLPPLTIYNTVTPYLPIYCQFVTYDPGPDRLWTSDTMTILVQ